MRRVAHDAERYAGREAGFFMIEAVVAIAIVAVCAGTVFAAVLAVQRQGLSQPPIQALTLSAQNVLTDLRAATAYDGAQLAALAGRSASFDVIEPAASGSPQPLHVILSVARSTVGGVTVASVTVRNARGQSATVQSTLVQEAPAPGSVLPAATPEPVPPCDGDAEQCGQPRAAIPL